MSHYFESSMFQILNRIIRWHLTVVRIKIVWSVILLFFNDKLCSVFIFVYQHSGLTASILNRIQMTPNNRWHHRIKLYMRWWRNWNYMYLPIFTWIHPCMQLAAVDGHRLRRKSGVYKIISPHVPQMMIKPRLKCIYCLRITDNSIFHGSQPVPLLIRVVFVVKSSGGIYIKIVEKLRKIEEKLIVSQPLGGQFPLSPLQIPPYSSQTPFASLNFPSSNWYLFLHSLKLYPLSSSDTPNHPPVYITIPLYTLYPLVALLWTLLWQTLVCQYRCLIQRSCNAKIAEGVIYTSSRTSILSICQIVFKLRQSSWYHIIFDPTQL